MNKKIALIGKYFIFWILILKFMKMLDFMNWFHRWGSKFGMTKCRTTNFSQFSNWKYSNNERWVIRIVEKINNFLNWTILNIWSFFKSVNYSNLGNWLVFQIRNFWNFPNWKINEFPKFDKLKIFCIWKTMDGSQNFERRNVERPIFRNFKITNIKITKDIR